MANKRALGNRFDLMNLLPGAEGVTGNAVQAEVEVARSPDPTPEAAPTKEVSRRRSGEPPRREEPEPPARARLERIPAQVPAPLLEEARRAVYWTPGLTLSGLVTEALEEHLARLKVARRKAGEEEDFPPLPSGQRIRTGRPIR
jgi:hypothetical protein